MSKNRRDPSSHRWTLFRNREQGLCFAVMLALCGCGGSTGTLPTSPTPAGPGQVTLFRSDDFERPDGAPGANWAWQLTAPTIRRGSLGSTNPGLVIAWWAADTFAPDQFSEAVVSPGFNPADTYALQVFVRRQPQAHGSGAPWRYAFHYQPSTGNYTLKYDGGSPGIVLAEIRGTQFVPGDIVRIEVQGSTIRGLLNGVVLLTSTHTALTGGQTGLVINPIYAVSLEAWDLWRGGELADNPSAYRRVDILRTFALRAPGWPIQRDRP